MANIVKTITASNGTSYDIQDKHLMVIDDSMVTVATDSTKGTSPYDTNYGYTNITVNDYANTDWQEGMIVFLNCNTTLVVNSAYRNARIRFGQDGTWMPIMGTSTILNAASYISKGNFRFYMYSTKYISSGALHLMSDSNTTYSPQSLGFGYGTCATDTLIASKTVTLSGYSLVTNGIVSVKFTSAVNANASMNINNKGSKPIYCNGAAITANIIKAGELATFIYDGTQYHLIAINRIFSGSYNDLTNKPTIPTKVSELTNDSGYTTNTGTVTSVAVKMNNSVKGTVTSSGTIDLGTVITSHQDISGKLDKTGGTLTGRLSVSTEAISLATGKITGLTAGTTQIFKDGIAISNPATANDLGFIRVTGTGESDTVMEIATGDDGGGGETIVFRGYNTSNNATYTATVPKKTGTIALTTDIPTKTGSPSGTTSVLTSVKSAGSTPTLGTAIPADDITAWSAGSLPTLGTAIPADDITAWSAGSGGFSYTCTTDTIAGAGALTISHTHTAPSLSYTAKSIPNVTSVGSVPTLEYTAVSIPNVTSAGSMPTFNSGNVASTSHTHTI